MPHDYRPGDWRQYYRLVTIWANLDRRVPLRAVALWPDLSVRLDAIEYSVAGRTPPGWMLVEG